MNLSIKQMIVVGTMVIIVMALVAIFYPPVEMDETGVDEIVHATNEPLRVAVVMMALMMLVMLFMLWSLSLTVSSLCENRDR